MRGNECALPLGHNGRVSHHASLRQERLRLDGVTLLRERCLAEYLLRRDGQLQWCQTERPFSDDRMEGELDIMRDLAVGELRDPSLYGHALSHAPRAEGVERDDLYNGAEGATGSLLFVHAITEHILGKGLLKLVNRGIPHVATKSTAPASILKTQTRMVVRVPPTLIARLNE